MNIGFILACKVLCYNAIQLGWHPVNNEKICLKTVVSTCY